MAAKRKIDDSAAALRSAKVPRVVKNKLATLSRQVSRLKPEIRQESFTITIVAGQIIPQPLLTGARTLQDAGTQEIRLHRIRVAYQYVLGDPLWGALYSYPGTSSSAAAQCLAIPANAFDIQNHLIPIDRTAAAVYKETNFTGPGNYYNNSAGQLIALDQRFTMPKTIKFQAEGQTNLPTNNIYYIGGNRSAAESRTIVVTVWYTNT